MKTYTTYDILAEDFFRPPGRRRFFTRADDWVPPDILHKNLRVVPVVEVGKSDPVGADEVKEGPVDTIDEDQCTRTWTVRAKTRQELKNRIDGVAVGNLVTVLTAIVNEERRNRSTPVNPITEAQFRRFVRGLLE